MTEAAAMLRARAGEEPIALALILGSGLGAMALEVDGPAVEFGALPGFPVSGVTGHAGQVVIGELEGVRVAALSGRVHYYEGGQTDAMRPVLETLHALGARRLLLTNAAGSTREDLPPGSLVALADHINLAGVNPLIGVSGDGRFVSMVDAYSATLRDHLRALGLPEGVYAWFSGPSFETPAEIRAARILGADLVGMSTVPECILARWLGMEVAAVSLVTNYAAGMTGTALSHEETKREAAAAADRFQGVVRGFLRAIA
ncbi:MAG: purine-nucleoside phosphorylase [Pseudomonadota bacterium]